ncbi:LLM class oxidoreductase [uncultured Aquimarina sp.]|uniref:LLM class oxidoreductase n=1 Tax=uncultured Aquimarina sp. TaxID=575652 RepID=UPI002634E23E|nr:LLM class oxidoreductase [uncultured Aquimarina sp.]
MYFEQINKAFNSTFQPNTLSIGVVIPIENYANIPIPTLENHLERVKLIEELGFKALWVRDVPFHVPSFGDAGQTYDPFTYLGYLAGQTSKITLGVASIALPLHHPVHVVKSAVTIDQLSDGRLILGVASGDRYDEYPAMNVDYQKRGKLFKEAFEYIRKSQDNFPVLDDNSFGSLQGKIDVLPKATSHKIPMLITGYSQQSLEWNAENGDGWMYYPRNPLQHQYTIAQWRELIPQENSKPFMQPLYIDLQKNNDFKPQPIHLGFKTGANYLIDYFQNLQDIGVNHIALNLRFNTNNIEDTLEQLSKKVLPHFHREVNEEIKL